MAKINYMKYLGLGLGATAVPALVMEFVPQVMEMLGNVPFITDDLFAGISVVKVALAAVGAWAVDSMMK